MNQAIEVDLTQTAERQIRAIGPHGQGADDIYELILAALQITMPEGERLKPPCCDDLDEPPVDPEAAERIASGIDALARRARRR